MKMKFMFFLMLSSLAGVQVAQAAGSVDAGKAKSAVCAGCHGMDGNSSISQYPKLAGQHGDYLNKQLQEFKSKKRDNAIMFGQVGALSDQDMADLAAFYASQKTKAGSADEALVTEGERIYRAGNAASGVSACIGCHGPSGNGNPAAKFPALSGQHADYIVLQLQGFRSGARSNDAGSMMRNIAAKMSDAEMKAVASYIQGLN